MSGQESVEFCTARMKLVSVEFEPFSPTVLEELGRLLGQAVSPALHWELQLIADGYRSQGVSWTTIRDARRQRMKAMARALRSALDAHEAIEASDLHDIVMVSPDATFDDLLILAEQLRKWTPVFDELAQRSLPRGLEENDRLLRCCERLRIFYEEVTGNQATHTSLDDLDETGLPQTAFGTFVRAFFRHVDADAEPRLNEALRKAIWPSRKRRAARAKSP